MTKRLRTIDPPIVVRGNTDTGEVMVIAPSGRVTFMSFWQFCRLAWDAARTGRTIAVQDD